MISPRRLLVYINAYTVRINKGEKIEDIDEDYLSTGMITEEDITKIHNELQLD